MAPVLVSRYLGSVIERQVRGCSTVTSSGETACKLRCSGRRQCALAYLSCPTDGQCECRNCDEIREVNFHKDGDPFFLFTRELELTSKSSIDFPTDLDVGHPLLVECTVKDYTWLKFFSGTTEVFAVMFNFEEGKLIIEREGIFQGSFFEYLDEYKTSDYERIFQFSVEYFFEPTDIAFYFQQSKVLSLEVNTPISEITEFRLESFDYGDPDVIIISAFH